jgi:hypothetical protein
MERGMRVLVQCEKTGRFLSDCNEWTDDIAKAVSFPSTVEATKHIRNCKLPTAAVLLKFADKRYDVRLDQHKSTD